MRGVGSTLASSIYISGVRTSIIGPIGKVNPRWRPLTSHIYEGCKQFYYHLPQLIPVFFRIVNQSYQFKKPWYYSSNRSQNKISRRNTGPTSLNLEETYFSLAEEDKGSLSNSQSLELLPLSWLVFLL
jgi:hypothetical protein